MVHTAPSKLKVLGWELMGLPSLASLSLDGRDLPWILFACWRLADCVAFWMKAGWGGFVGMFDCCLQGIQPCEWKGNGHQ